MKKVLPIFLVIVTLFWLTSCKKEGSAENAGDPQAHVNVQYAEDLLTFEDIMKYSSCIVKATLKTTEDFSGIKVYGFEVEEDFTENTPDKINVYDAYNEAYIVGHTYYLFLSKGETPLFPHTIYSSVFKELIIDTAEKTASLVIQAEDVTINVDTLSDEIENAVKKGIVGTKLDKSEVLEWVSEETDIEAVKKSADVIAEIKVSSEANANKYASTYKTEVMSVEKGTASMVPASMSLPPELDGTKTYYIFLKEVGGAYLLFSRAYPVAQAEVYNADS